MFQLLSSPFFVLLLICFIVSFLAYMFGFIKNNKVIQIVFATISLLTLIFTIYFSYHYLNEDARMKKYQTNNTEVESN
jgi:amino acid permease